MLGAQATKTAGLKHVTTKHLALAGEVCRFWSVLVLDVEKICLSNFERHKAKGEDADKIRKNIKKEFQETRSLFMEQVVDIYEKLIAIMKETISSIINVLTVDDFLKNDNHSDFKVSPYMESIVKKTLTIAKSVQRYLPEEEYNGIMIRIFEEYQKLLSVKYKAIISSKISNNVIKSQIRTDLLFFMEKLQDIIDTRQIVEQILSSIQIELDEKKLDGETQALNIDKTTEVEDLMNHVDDSSETNKAIEKNNETNHDNLDLKTETATDNGTALNIQSNTEELVAESTPSTSNSTETSELELSAKGSQSEDKDTINN